MSMDYLIGFKEKPRDFEAFLLERNFQLDSTRDLDAQFVLYAYRQFVENKSKRGVYVTYYDGLEPDDERLWQKIAPERPTVATASVTTNSGRNWFDESQQRTIARDIRDHYDALVFDPQAARFMHDIRKVCEVEHITYPIHLREWFASQWSSTAVAVYTGASGQPAKIIERPAEWGQHWGWNFYDDGIYFQRTK